MRVGIVVVVYLEYPTLVFESIIGQTIHNITWYIHCHSSDKQLERSLIEFSETQRCDLRLHRSNRGLARSWNDGIQASYADRQDFTLVVNDDISFRRGAFDAFITFLMDRPAFALGFLFGEEPGHEGLSPIIRSQDFACFAFGMLAYVNIGAFDENFFPAYSEDTDYTIRVNKMHLPMITDARVLVDHERSKTFKRSPDIRANIEAIGHANNAYLFKKWGWENGQPTFDQQFGTHGCFISWTQRRTPFGKEKDRADLPLSYVPALQILSGVDSGKTTIDSLGDQIVAHHHAICAYAVQAIYKSLLRRDAEPNAIARYSAEMLAGLRGLSDFITEVRQSVEYADTLHAHISPNERGR